MNVPMDSDSRAQQSERPAQRMMRADLHVHSYHSGYNHDLPFLRSRDCYNCPEAVYRTAKARGMDIVTITDHDSIDGCLEFLSRHPDTPDFIIGEEITCWMPGTGGPPIEVRWNMFEVHHQNATIEWLVAVDREGAVWSVSASPAPWM